MGILLGLDLLRIAGTSYSNARFFINATATQEFYKVTNRSVGEEEKRVVVG